jgi:hypothetical protein
MISISAKAGLKANGADEIQKRDKNPMPFLANPIIVTDKKNHHRHDRCDGDVRCRREGHW